MKRLRILAALLLMPACEEKITVPPAIVTPGAIVNLVLVPASATAQVGQSVQFVSVVSGSTNQNATFTSSNTSVAAVSGIGLAVCVAPGVAAITAVSIADALARDASTLTCEASTPLIQISSTTLSFTHTVGTTDCPQVIGTVQVTNTSSGSVQVNLTGHSALSVDASSFTLAAGASRTITVSFNCSTQTSFNGTMTVTATGAGTSDAKSVQVAGTIN